VLVDQVAKREKKIKTLFKRSLERMVERSKDRVSQITVCPKRLLSPTTLCWSTRRQRGEKTKTLFKRSLERVVERSKDRVSQITVCPKRLLSPTTLCWSTRRQRGEKNKNPL
jgi:hypothetical protein